MLVKDRAWEEKVQRYRTWCVEISNLVSYQALRYLLRNCPKQRKVLLYFGPDHKEIIEEQEIPESEHLSDEEIAKILQDQRDAYRRATKGPKSSGGQETTGSSGVAPDEKKEEVVRILTEMGIPEKKRSSLSDRILKREQRRKKGDIARLIGPYGYVILTFDGSELCPDGADRYPVQIGEIDGRPVYAVRERIEEITPRLKAISVLEGDEILELPTERGCKPMETMIELALDSDYKDLEARPLKDSLHWSKMWSRMQPRLKDSIGAEKTDELKGILQAKNPELCYVIAGKDERPIPWSVTYVSPTEDRVYVTVRGISGRPIEYMEIVEDLVRELGVVVDLRMPEEKGQPSEFERRLEQLAGGVAIPNAYDSLMLGRRIHRGVGPRTSYRVPESIRRKVEEINREIERLEDEYNEVNRRPFNYYVQRRNVSLGTAGMMWEAELDGIRHEINSRKFGLISLFEEHGRDLYPEMLMMQITSEEKNVAKLRQFIDQTPLRFQERRDLTDEIAKDRARIEELNRELAYFESGAVWIARPPLVPIEDQETTGSSGVAPDAVQSHDAAVELLEHLREVPLQAGRISAKMEDEKGRILQIFDTVYRRSGLNVRRGVFDKVVDRVARHIVQVYPPEGGHSFGEKVLEELGEIILSQTAVWMRSFKLTGHQVYQVMLRLSSEEVRELTNNYPRFIVSHAFGRSDPVTAAQMLNENYEEVLQHILSQGEDIENARSIAGRAFINTDYIAAADRYLANYRMVVEFVKEKGRPEIARTIAGQSYYGKEPLVKAERFLIVYDDLLEYLVIRKDGEDEAEWKMRCEVAGSITAAAFTSPEARTLADKYWDNYLKAYRLISAKGDEEIARLIAHHAFRTKKPLKEARRYYRAYQKVVERLTAEGEGEIARSIAEMVFTSRSYMRDARERLGIYKSIVADLTKRGYGSIAKTVAHNVIASSNPTQEAEDFISRYNEIKTHLETKKEEEKEAIWQRRKAIAGTIALAAAGATRTNYLDLADTYVGRYEAVRDRAISRGYEAMANTVANASFFATDYLEKADRLLGDYETVVEHVKERAKTESHRRWVENCSPELVASKVIVAGPVHPIQLADTFIERFDEIMVHLEGQGVERAIAGIAQNAFNRDNHIAEAERMVKNYQDILELCRKRGIRRGALDIANRLCKSTAPIKDAEEMIASSLPIKILQAMEGKRLQVKVDLDGLRLFHETLPDEYRELVELAQLTEQEIEVLELRSGIRFEAPYTLEEVRERPDFNMTRERVRQIEEGALEKINTYLRSRYPTIRPLSINTLSHKRVDLLPLSIRAKRAMHWLVDLRLEQGSISPFDVRRLVLSQEGFGKDTADEIEEYLGQIEGVMNIDTITHEEVEPLPVSTRAKTALHWLIDLREEQGPISSSDIRGLILSQRNFGERTANEIARLFSYPVGPIDINTITREQVGLLPLGGRARRALNWLIDLREEQGSISPSNVRELVTSHESFGKGTADEIERLLALGEENETTGSSGIAPVEERSVLVVGTKGEESKESLQKALQERLRNIDLRLVAIPDNVNPQEFMERKVEEEQKIGREALGIILDRELLEETKIDNVEEMISPYVIYLRSGKPEAISRIIEAIELRLPDSKILDIIKRENLTKEEIQHIIEVLLEVFSLITTVDWQARLESVRKELNQAGQQRSTITTTGILEERPDVITALSEELIGKQKDRNILLITDSRIDSKTKKKMYLQQLDQALRAYSKKEGKEISIHDLFGKIVTFAEFEGYIVEETEKEKEEPIFAAAETLTKKVIGEPYGELIYIGGRRLFKDEINLATIIKGVLHNNPESIKKALEILGKDKDKITIEQLRRKVIDLRGYTKDIQAYRRTIKEVKRAL